MSLIAQCVYITLFICKMGQPKGILPSSFVDRYKYEDILYQDKALTS